MFKLTQSAGRGIDRIGKVVDPRGRTFAPGCRFVLAGVGRIARRFVLPLRPAFEVRLRSFLRPGRCSHIGHENVPLAIIAAAQCVRMLSQ